MDAAARAKQELEDAIQQLGGLRNAGTRSPEFKQWRQNTLTLVQRVWPGDPVRSERFRRIPFSFPSTKADIKTHREYYERGCAEALQLLKGLLAELQGLPFDAASSASPAEAPPEVAAEPKTPPSGIERLPASFLGDTSERSVIAPLGADVSFERPVSMDDVLDLDPPLPRTLDAHRKSPPPARDEIGEAIDPAPSQPPRLPSLPRSLPSAAPPAPPAAPAAPAGGPPALPVAPTAPAVPKPEPADVSEVIGGPNPILSDATPAPVPAPPRGEISPAVVELPPEPPSVGEPPPEPTHDPEVAPEPQPPPAAERSAKGPSREGKRSRGEQRRLKEMLGLDELEREVRAEQPPARKPSRGNGGKKDVATTGRPGKPSPPSRAPGPAASGPPPPASEAPADDRSERQVTSDFLDASPVLRATARPVPARPTGGSELTRDAARAVDRLARMVADLDVPEGRRAQVRAMLMGLARELDQGSPRWGVIADSISAAMEFPPLARALLPYLLPELDRAA